MLVETANRFVGREEVDISVATARLNEDVYTLNSDVDLYEFGGGSPSQLKHWVRLPEIIVDINTIIKENDIDVVVFHSIPTTYWSLVLKKFNPDVSFVWYAHDPNSYLNLPGKIKDVQNPMRTLIEVGNPIINWFDKHIISSSIDHVISNSQFTSRIIAEEYNLNSEVIFPGIDTSKFTNGSYSFNNQSISNNIIFSVGQINKYKNFDTLIYAMSALNERIDQSPELVIAGTGSHKSNLVELADRLNVYDLVDFVGRLTESELIDYYARALVTAYLPENEPFGLVPVESMACGTPVIARDSGGIRETVDDCQTGILLSQLTPEKVADAIHQLLINHEETKKMGKEAQNRMRAQFSIKKTVDSLENRFVKYGRSR